MENNQDEKKNAIIKWMDGYIDTFIISGSSEISGYVEKLRQQNPKISDIDLAKKIVGRKSFKNGLVGAATGVGGLITLPVTVPVDIVATWKIQITLAFAIAHVFGHTKDTTDLRTDIYLILAGSAAQEALKKVGIQVGKEVTKRAIQKNISQEVMKKIWKIVPQKIITKSGQKSLTSFSKMVPLIGAPIGFAFDYFGTKTVGNFAVKYYSGN